ncbi:hypothetical protein Salat_0718600 [Sesamum alatum]|uniref:F-box domain-containing protein n=1 Tax=Sesamum alatum TaxID=300844 RepID=A0AAE1YSS7_9LAMI|nr:hypothetical protein Salat_0718600 [Sesamum alatum]
MKRRTRNGGSGKRRKAPKIGNGVSQLSLMDLPTAVLHEIFFKLPVSSIINAKFVCTELYKTLSDPEFAVNYTKNTRFTSIFSIKHRLTDDLDSPIFILTEISEDYEYFETALTPRIPDFVDLNSSLSLRRTCDGLLCLNLMEPRAEVAHICNPLTGDYLALPPHKPKRGYPLSLVYGLGFCQSANKYKVLRVICDPAEPGNGYGEILTIGVDSGWRSLANPAVPMPEFLLDLNSLNGVLHWLFFAGNRSSCIYSFDLGEERLGQMPGPPGVVLNCERMRLVLLSNQLCLVDPSKRNTLVIWKMKEHASGNSWTKDIILSKSFPRRVRFRGHWPLAISRNGEIIMSDPLNNFVVSYNPEKGTCTKIKVFEMERFAYTPSLLSLQELISGRHWRNMNVLSN